ncbi:DUF167 domain-containing protein [Candidatus Saccharibacteria bacterium]|nr:DUF167 domain-containing protein [Candidatus Saccharibacteria bacterium]
MTKKVIVHVKPGSKKGPLVVSAPNGDLVIYVRQAALDGEANKAAQELLAQHFGVPKTNVQLISGKKSKLKQFKIMIN